MTKHQIRVALTATLLLSLPAIMAAESATENPRAEPVGFVYGIGVGLNQELYQDYRRRVVPIPVIGYRGDRLSVYGPFISYQLLQQDGLTLTARLAPRFAGTDASKSPVFEGMKKRRTSADAGFGLRYDWQQLRFETSWMHDILGNSDGYEVRNRIGYQHRFGPVFVEPHLSLDYSNARLVNYYYGVRPEEATSSRPAYQAGSAWNPALGVSVATPIFFGGMTRLGVDHRWYHDTIADSPLTDRQRGFQVFFSFSRFF
ncbi:MipA/OmpV family protein [Alkalimonas delamerensis]|uniref:MipA/OmpV family protein n=1 Tax=Alkalimonas delamerensis TaxID=265981 RepID=A0ABT9GP90_9GAMM|nr:MipA/OmpV family protein [Alkalimonas delamerensis]MDP4528785.1 MipA/OmpV family protein [Alkalimonas delamerensis]